MMESQPITQPFTTQLTPGFFGSHIVPSSNQPAWVPFAGTKRKAQDSDILYDKEFGPSPAKQCAVDESVADIVLNKDGILIGTLDCNNATGGGTDVQRKPQDLSPQHLEVQDEEMNDLMVDTSAVLADTTSNEFTGVHHQKIKGINFFRGVGGNDNGDSEVDLHETSCPQSVGSLDNNVTNPKIYFFEGLKEVLEKRNEDLSLPRSLIQQVQKESSMAMVLWKPHPEKMGFLHPVSSSTCARTVARKPPCQDKTRQKQKVEEELEESNIEEMDVSV